MIDTKTVAEIERLLSEDELSQRQIALLTGISRGSVATIAAGKRAHQELPQELEEEKEEAIETPKRCPDCGGLVYLPCRLCLQRTRMARKAGSSSQAGVSEPKDRPALALRPDHQAGYEDVRRWRRAHQGRPMEGRHLG